MNQRKNDILKLVIETYIKTAEPIGSQVLVESGKLEVSGATVRNELHELEEMGYLTHPHTSAGRIPTEKGYKYYVETILKEREKGEAEKLEGKIKDTDNLKELGKQSAAASQNAVIVISGPNVYYTGTSYLYSQPEFEDAKETIQVSEVFDNFEDHVTELFDLVPQGQERIFIGSENPFGGNISTIVVKINDDVLFGFVGPMRMDYKKNLSLIEYIQSLIEQNRKFLN